MTIVVPHHKSKAEVVAIVDKATADLFATGVGGGISIVDQKKEWSGSTMTFSFKGRMGFISVPLSGTVAVDDQNVTVICDLPAMLKNFIGEEKAQAVVTQKVKGLLA